MTSDPVNHPDHYGGDSVYEVIKVLHAWGLNRNANLFNVVKYIARAGSKVHFDSADTHGVKLEKKRRARIEDLKKAAFYLNYEIEFLEGKREV